jgi:uncharacterized protein (DUF58 family)
MRPTRRALELGGIGVVLALCAAAFAQPLVLFGAAGVGAWLLGRQRAFVAAAERVDQSLTVRSNPSQPTTSVDRELPVAVAVALDEPVPLSLSLEPAVPLAATLADASTATLDAGETRAELSYAVEFHVAGAHELPRVEITLRDERGLFEETIERGHRPAVTVVANGPSRLHVGRGASSVTDGYGERDRGTASRGLEPQEIREYLPGDIAKDIDWNVTARLGDLYVRQYGTENDRHVVVVLDQREAMGVGPAGETKFDYARAATLGFLENAESVFDSVTLYAVDGDAVLSRRRTPSAGRAARSLRDPQFALRPRSGGGSGGATTSRPRVSPLDRGRVAGRLRDGHSTFDRRLAPYFGSRVRTDAVDEDPVRTAVRRERGATEDDLGVVLVTDDTAPNRVRETVRYARRTADRVTLFLTPQVLFEPGGLDDLETAYERYLEFEEFRRELDRLPNVYAFEVGPGDRLGAIVDSRRAR